jgi:hypothetical protein
MVWIPCVAIDAKAVYYDSEDCDEPMLRVCLDEKVHLSFQNGEEHAFFQWLADKLGKPIEVTLETTGTDALHYVPS